MDTIIELLANYGWQAVVVALLDFAIIECCKPCARKLIKKEQVRHTLYTVASYVLCFGLAVAMAAILKKFDMLLNYVGSSIIVANVLAPIFANVGFFNWIEKVVGQLWGKMSESGQWKKAVTEIGKAFGVDSAMLDVVATKIEEEYMPLIKEGANLFFDNNEEELTMNITQKLAGFVKNEQLQDVAKALFDKLKESWKKDKSNEVKEDEPVTDSEENKEA